MRYLILVLIGCLCLAYLNEPKENCDVEMDCLVVPGESCGEARSGRPVCVASGESGRPNATETELLDFATHARVTAYCPCARCCGKWADGYTASGKPVTANGGRFVAAPPEIPFGTMLIVPGYAGGQPVPVLDRGGAIKGNRLDVFFPTHQEALNWGVQHLRVRRSE